MLTIDGEPWFIAKDVAQVLGYTDTEAMTRRLDDDEVKPTNRRFWLSAARTRHHCIAGSAQVRTLGEPRSCDAYSRVIEL